MNDKKLKDLGKKLNIDWHKVSKEQFLKGMGVELEHGTKDKKTNVTNNDPVKTAKIVLAHLKEDDNYYTALAKMEKKFKKK